MKNNFFWENLNRLNALHPGKFCVWFKLVWWFCGRGYYIFTMSLLFPRTKGAWLSFLNKNSLKFHMDVLWQIRLKLKLSIYFWNFTIIFSLKEFGPLFEQIVIPFPWRCFVSSLAQIDKVVLQKKTKIYKVWYDIDNDMWQWTNFDKKKSSLELSAQVS